MNKIFGIIILFILVIIVIQSIIIKDLCKIRTQDVESIVIDSIINYLDRMSDEDKMDEIALTVPKPTSAATALAASYIESLKGTNILFEELTTIEEFLAANRSNLSEEVLNELNGRLELYKKIENFTKVKDLDGLKECAKDGLCTPAQKEALEALYDHVSHEGKEHKYNVKQKQAVKLKFKDASYCKMSDFIFMAKVTLNLV